MSYTRSYSIRPIRIRVKIIWNEYEEIRDTTSFYFFRSYTYEVVLIQGRINSYFYTSKIRIRPFFTKYNVVFVLVQSDSNDYNGVRGQEEHMVHPRGHLSRICILITQEYINFYSAPWSLEDSYGNMSKYIITK